MENIKASIMKLGRTKILFGLIGISVLIIILLSLLLFRKHYGLACEFNGSEYSYGIQGEEGEGLADITDEGTDFTYDINGNREPYTENNHGTLTYNQSGNKYNIVEKITVDEIHNKIDYVINVSGGGFGKEVKTCTSEQNNY